MTEEAADMFRSRHGLGASGIAAMFAPLSEDAATETLETAWQGGIRVFDTAPLYGHGLSELRLGRFLRERPRRDYTLSTKVGRDLVPPYGNPVDPGIWAHPLPLRPVFDYSHDGTSRSLEQSASRLATGLPDIVHIHDVDPFTHGTAFERRFDEAVTGCYRALDELRAGGHLRAIGVGVNDAATALRFMRAVRLDVVLIAGRYTLLDQSALDELFPLAESMGIAVIAAGVFNSGVLATGSAARGATYDYAPAPAPVRARVARIEAVCAVHGVSLPAAAIAFAGSHPVIGNVLLGMREAEEAHRNLHAIGQAVPPAFWDDLKTKGLLRPDAPVGSGTGIAP